MARPQTYGNWLGPPPAPTQRLGRAAGIYSVAGKTAPAADFRPASPDSFEDDYDDVSLAEVAGGHQLPVAGDDRQSQGSTGLYILAGKPPSLDPKGHSTPATAATTTGACLEPGAQPRGSRPRSSPGCCQRGTAVAVLYVLVTLSLVAWGLLFALAVVKHTEILVELELLRANGSQDRAQAQQELAETRREQTRLRNAVHQHHAELQDMAAQLCWKMADSRRCSAGWKVFEKSCYFFSSGTLSWPEAKETCTDHSAHLVIIDSEQEQSFLKDNINNGSFYWLGLRHQQPGGTWRWTNGNETSFSYWNAWDKGKDKEQKGCGSIGPQGIWQGYRCSRSNRWICEKPLNC